MKRKFYTFLVTIFCLSPTLVFAGPTGPGGQSTLSLSNTNNSSGTTQQLTKPTMAICGLNGGTNPDEPGNCADGTTYQQSANQAAEQGYTTPTLPSDNPFTPQTPQQALVNSPEYQNTAALPQAVPGQQLNTLTQPTANVPMLNTSGTQNYTNMGGQGGTYYYDGVAYNCPNGGIPDGPGLCNNPDGSSYMNNGQYSMPTEQQITCPGGGTVVSGATYNTAPTCSNNVAPNYGTPQQENQSGVVPSGGGTASGTYLPGQQQAEMQCIQAQAQAQSTCNGMGPAAMAAKAAQQGAGQAGQTIVLQNAANGLQPDPHAACMNQMMQGGTAAASSAMVAMACKSAASQCEDVCGSVTPSGTFPNDQILEKAYGSCQGLQNTGDMMMAVGAITGLGGAVAGIFCGDATAPTPIPSGMQQPPTDPPWNPNNGNTPNGSGGGGVQPGYSPPFLPTDGNSGINAGLPNGAGAGGGPTGPAASPGGGGPQKDYDLGLSNGSGAVGFSGGGGGGWPTAKNNGMDPKDLLGLLKGDRMPASAEEKKEISGANDLTNFQKVTRMMNKKRPMLKAAE